MENDPKPGGGWQVTGAALLVGAIAGVAWFAVSTPAEHRSAEAAPAPAPASAPRAGNIAELMRVEAPAEPPPIELAANEALVCGQVVSRTALYDDRVARTLRDAGAAAALAQFAQARLADDDHARAVGLVLRMQADANYGEGGSASCSSEDCWKQASRAHAERVRPLLTELAQLAATSTDARALVLAREQCAVLTHDAAPLPHCQQLTARRWVALERDNAAAWLALAAEEAGSLDEAMYQAANARRWDDYATSARRFVERVDAKGGLRSMVLVQALLSTPGAQPITAQQGVLQHCSENAVAADANRRLQCEQLADSLRTRSNSLTGLTAAARVAKALGRDEAQTWHDEARLLGFVQQSRTSDDSALDADARECAFGLPRELLLRSAREGEVPALRALLLASELTQAQWHERLAAADAVLVAQAAASASAPR